MACSYLCMSSWMSCHSESPKGSWEAWQPVIELMCLHHIRECRRGRWRCLSWPVKSEMVDEENAAQKLTGNHSRHIEWSHMDTTHSVMRVSRPCCLSVDWGLQGQRLHCTFWCQWMLSGGRDKKRGNHFLLSWHCNASEQDHRYGCWTIEKC